MRASIATLTLLCLAPLACQSAEPVTLSPAVTHLVKPVLTSFALYAKNETTVTTAKFEAALDAVLFDRSPVGTEALAVLAGIYIGEHGAEDVSCELVARGASALPHLQNLSTGVVTVPGINMRSFHRTPGEYAIILERIQRGEHCEREP